MSKDLKDYKNGDWVGYLPEHHLWYYEVAGGANKSIFNEEKIIVATGEFAYTLLKKAKGDNGSKISKLFPDEKFRIPISKIGLEFIQKIGIEYIKNHPNEITIKEFRLFLRCLWRLYDINQKEEDKKRWIEIKEGLKKDE